MTIKKLKSKLAISTSIGILLFSAFAPPALAFSNANTAYSEDNISVDIKQIKEIAETTLIDVNSLILPSQSLAETAALMVELDNIETEGVFYTGTDVLKYLYPKDTAEQLKTESVTAEQVVQWLASIGYTATVINRSLTTDEIKKNLDNSQPMLTVLEGQNDEDWLNKTSAGMLYAHDDVETGTETGNLHESFIKTYNYGEATIQDGAEAEPFQFSATSENPDEIQRTNSFKWVKTITDLKKDPSWENREQIREDRKSGIFNTTLIKEGSNIVEADFIDQDVMHLWGADTSDSSDVSTTKLDAVALINLYFDSEHQKTVADLNNFANLSEDEDISSKQIEDWYSSLGFVFDTIDGKLTKSFTKTLGSEGKLYLTVLDAVKADNPRKNEAVIGVGFADNTIAYTVDWVNVKGEQINPQYIVDYSLSTAITTQNEKMRNFDYDVVRRDGFEGSTYYSWDYNTETTIYNIRQKDSPTPTETPFTNSEPTNSNSTNSVSLPVATYYTAPDFGVRETQGQEPWCSEYVAAAAINTIGKAKELGKPITTAKEIMRAYKPGVPDDELTTMTGGDIGESLKHLQETYQVTADVENHSLSFEEVKKEIDSDKIIQLDGYDINETAERGTMENPGHSLAIVGYVLPADGNTAVHTPYYEIWNPWWEKTFYISTNFDTMLMGGVEYEWTRTWHNWRKTDAGATVNVSSDVEHQKVGSNVNPAAIPTYSSPTIFNPLGKKINNQVVSQMGSETTGQAYFVGSKYGYAISGDNQKMRVRKNKNTKMITLGLGLNFRDSVNALGSGRTTALVSGVGLAVVVAVAAFFPEGVAALEFVNKLAGTFVGKIITGMLGLPGDLKTGAIAIFLASLGKYLYDSYKIEGAYQSAIG
ncbi:C47 family peptidase [Lactococcus nasutitermitis]|uniref:C47 family peptidase n=1 Tax=Lactococcus nasutitermitis TaxID=1652957 RepID=A0ABV9JAT0_9LACT|nr:C47 family peptidase [Lactococcus nasutitermitis]